MSAEVGCLFAYLSNLLKSIGSKVAGVKIYPRQNQNIGPHAVTACISNVTSWPIFPEHYFLARDVTWMMHALTAWVLMFQSRLGSTFTPATLIASNSNCLCVLSCSPHPNFVKTFPEVRQTILSIELLVPRHSTFCGIVKHTSLFWSLQNDIICQEVEVQNKLPCWALAFICK
jgi:hypothetical protein